MIDINGTPYGPIKGILAKDIKKMAKELNPNRS